MDRNIYERDLRARFIRQKELLRLVPFSPATLWRKVKAGSFVKPVKLSARITAWNRAEVLEWLEAQGDRP